MLAWLDPDLDLEKRILKVGSRTIPLAPEAIQALRDYLADRGSKREKPLFLSQRGGRIEVRNLWSIVKKLSFLAGIEKTVTLNAIRRTFGVHWIQDQKDPFTLAKVLGLKSLNGLAEYSDLANLHAKGSAFVVTSTIGGTLERLDMRRARQAWQKISQRLVIDDLEGAISSTRTLLEDISKKILVATGSQIGATENLSALCKKALIAVLPQVDVQEEHLTRFSRTAAGLIEQLALYRNAFGDAHGSAQEREIEKAQAQYAIELAQATATFLVHCYASYVERQNLSLVEAAPKGISLTVPERDVVQLLLRTAARTSSGSTADAYNDIIEALPSKEDARRGALLELDAEQAHLLASLVPSADGISSGLSAAARRISKKLEGEYPAER